MVIFHPDVPHVQIFTKFEVAEAVADIITSTKFLGDQLSAVDFVRSGWVENQDSHRWSQPLLTLCCHYRTASDSVVLYCIFVIVSIFELFCYIMYLRFMLWHIRWSNSWTRLSSFWFTWCQVLNVAVFTRTMLLVLTCSVERRCEFSFCC